MSGSVAVHAVVGALLALLHPHHASVDDTAGPLTIEVVETLPPRESKSIDAVGDDGGGSSPSRGVDPLPRVEARARVTARRRTESAANEDPRGEVTFEHDDQQRDEGGDGSVLRATSGALGEGGAGNGRGDGDGLGMGAAGSREVPVPPPPPPPPGEPARVSKARPARLVYPKRNRAVDDGETFVARVTVDADGYVVGARLVRGFGGRRDDEAASLIFKFRYAPALDDDGRPIRSTVDQNFLVE